MLLYNAGVAPENPVLPEAASSRATDRDSDLSQYLPPDRAHSAPNTSLVWTAPAPPNTEPETGQERRS